MAGVPISAKNCSVRINGVTLYASEWEVRPETAWDDCTNFESAGFETQVACTSKCEVHITGWYDATGNIYDAPLLLQDGVTLLNVALYIDGVGSPNWSFPNLSVIGAPMTARVKEKIKYDFRGKANGAFVYPTGSA